MAGFNKFDCAVGDIGLKLHQLNTDTLKVYLTNATPVVGNTVYNTPADLATSGGYTAGGQDVTNTWTQAGGLWTLAIGADLVWTGSGAGFGPFRYAVLYNDTPSTPGVDPLIGYWDYGSSITLNDTETFTVDFGASMFTIA